MQYERDNQELAQYRRCPQWRHTAHRRHGILFSLHAVETGVGRRRCQRYWLSSCSGWSLPRLPAYTCANARWQLPSGPQGSLTCLSSRSSTWSVIRPLDDFLQKIKTPSDLDDAPWLSWGDRAERQVIGCRDLDRTRESKVEVDPPEQYNSGHFSSNELRYEELPRAPPPSPILGAASHGGWNGPDSLGRGDDPTIYNSAYGGRRCVSKSTAPSSLLTTSTTTSRTWSSFLKTNQERVFSSCTPSCGKDHGVDSSLGSNPPAVAEHSQGEGEYDEGMSVFSNDEVFEVACQTALPLPSLEECHLLAQEMTAMEEAESEGGFFSEAPLEVPGGVALTEEGVESATADIALL